MLERESDGSGWSVTMRPQGAARFVLVAFLSAWLCGWAAGEVFAGVTFFTGLRDLLAPDFAPHLLRRMGGKLPANPWPALAFLAVWLTFWTLGGLSALWTALRLAIGHDVVAWDHDGMRVRECVGPFARSRTIAWREVGALHVQSRGRVVAHARRGLWPITGGGSAEDRSTLGEWLTTAWHESRGAEAEAEQATRESPPGWVARLGDDGRGTLVRDRRGARGGAVLTGLVAAALWWFGGSVALHGRGDEAGVVIAVALNALIGLLFAALSSWLATGHEVLLPSERRLVREHRWMGHAWRRELVNPTLRLGLGRDSDGDERWSLVARDENGPVTLATELHAPGAARALGMWLAARLAVPLETADEPDPRDERRSA